MNTFKDKVVWITGASSGIGEALALAFAAQNAKLILSSRRKEILEKVKRKCLNINQLDIEILTIDLADSASLEAKAKAAESIFGHIDILVNNGGISQRGTVLKTDMSVQRKIIEVNYFGSIALSKYVLPKMIERKSGQQVVITSAVGIISTPLRSAYAASKHALHGYYDALRAECHNDNIAVTLICPGFVSTNVSINALTGNGEKYDVVDASIGNGLSPDKLAKLALKAISKRKEEVYIGGSKEVMAIYLKRFFPSLFSKMVRNINVK